MVTKVNIKKGDYGMTYQFTIENVNLSQAAGYTPKINIWKGITSLITGGSCTSVYTSPDTIVSYIVATEATSVEGRWSGEIEFTKTGYKESTKTFEWEVEVSNPAS